MKVIPSVLLVDDDLSDLTLSELVLKRAQRFPYVFRARSGAEVLTLFTQTTASQRLHPGLFPPDLMFIDVRMPKMGGLRLLEELLSLRDTEVIPAVPPIIMLSASLDPREEAHALAHPLVVGFRPKPLRLDAVVEIADELGREHPPA